VKASVFSAVSVGAVRERLSTTDHIVDALRRAIQSGDLEDGVELSQVGLAQHFGVSRVPVREALRALEAEGWVTAPTNLRAYVQSLSPDEIDEIFRARFLLEPDLIGRSIPQMDATVIADLRARCDEMDAMQDHAGWVGRNREFHRALLAPSGATYTIGLIEQMTAQVERYLRRHYAQSDRHGDAGAEHRALVDAVAAKDVRTAKAILREHIDDSRRGVLEAVRNGKG
jgi:DNA-binding GntR family transcriptional regulator